MVLIRVLGAAAGGGFPQWNCACGGCRRARSGDSAARPRTQASLAVSADGGQWILLNASPDLPRQIMAAPQLHPRTMGGRDSPIAAVVISSGDVDCIAGLLSLREKQGFSLYAGDPVMRILDENSIFRVLDPELVRREALADGRRTGIVDGGGNATGLLVEAFAVGGKIPLYHESADADDFASDEAVIGLDVSDGAGRRLVFIPACAAVTPGLAARIEGADILFFDGTLWRDDEMIRSGTGGKTGRRMGHMSVSGPDGSIAALAATRVGRRVFIHLNNTNPLLCDDSPEAAQARAAGWEIARDGMEIGL
ncbi:MAG TPA: pyrroloquinoline quinone biosynthesis protein PqqB [Acetobacteraceae bacterium]|nr:pyrroloquinoline quinone biosynthesis protein PqqB [Acetobacteraceae bacterium]